MQKKTGIVGLSPMDGVTDLAMRTITAKYGRPDLMMTEFANVEGLMKGPERLWKELWVRPEEKTVVQLYGLRPENFLAVTKKLIAENNGGIKGIDLNMGCPARNVALNGAGAGLIKNKSLAKEIYLATKEGASDGKLPVSIKTRIGYEKSEEMEEWIGWILEELKPTMVTLHGRTFRQGYSGQADWEAIGRAAEMTKRSGVGTKIIGNGDVRNRTEAETKIEKYGVDGVLIGRAAMGDPAVFLTETEDGIDQELDYIKIMLEHARLYEEIYAGGEKYSFLPMRKHLAWYVRGVPEASKIRMALCQTNSSEEVEKVLKEFSLISD